MARLIASPPRDPRFSVTWDAASKLRVTIDARDGNRYLNRLNFALDVSPASATPVVTSTTTTRASAQPIPQTGPGRYELAIDAPAVSSIATLRHDGRVIDRSAVAGRYPPEFDAIGVDRAALAELARRTGGRVIEPSDTSRIDLPAPRQGSSLVAYLAAVGALLLAAGLVRWRTAQ